MSRFAILASMLAAVTPQQSVSRPDVAVVEDVVETRVIVGFEWIDQPLGRIVLIKTPRSACAVRFISFSRDDGSTQAHYDVATISSNGLAQKKIASRRLSDEGMVGFGHWAWRRGDHEIRCGTSRIPWMFPTGVALIGSIEVAPTAWTEFEQVNVKEPKLGWYRLDSSQTRAFFLIPVTDLPGSKGTNNRDGGS